MKLSEWRNNKLSEERDSRRTFHGQPLLATFPLTNRHEVEALLLTCIDFRFWSAAINFLLKHLGLKTIDIKTDAGGAKSINSGEHSIRRWILDNAEIAIKKHKVKRVIAMVHFDCAAYGGSQRFGSAAEELRFLMDEVGKACRSLSNELSVSIEGYVLVIDGEEVGIVAVPVE
jgi:carbonic anhydrase